MKSGVFLVLAAIAVSGCGNGESADVLFTRGEAATHRVPSYDEAEEALGEFLDRFPNDPRADVALQSLARVLLSRQKYDDAVGRYRQLADTYPESRYRDQAQFMIGYVLDLKGDLEGARVAYEKVIALYPDSDLADDALLSIQNLGKAPEDWLAPDESGASSDQAGD